MINANELRIGNMIQWKSTGEIDTVGDIMTVGRKNHTINNVNINDCDPIPITEQWLLRAGAKKHHHKNDGSMIMDLPEGDDDDSFYIEFLKRKDGKFSIKIRGDATFDYGSASIKISDDGYVHTLQNLWHSLTGQELTFTETITK
jgi:hypothetical protein